MGDFLRNLMCKSAFFARNEGIMADFSFFVLMTIIVLKSLN